MRYFAGIALLFGLGTATAFPYPAAWEQEVPMARSRLRDRHEAVVDTPQGREMLLLFALAVKGWRSDFALPALEKFLGRTRTPFDFVRSLETQGLLLERIRWASLSRNYGALAVSYRDVVSRHWDLGAIELEDLLTLNGVSYKTAEYFLMYSRVGYAGFAPDVHVLNYLRRRFPRSRVPVASPSKEQCGEFLRLRALYESEAKRLGLSFRDLDTRVWEAGRVGAD